MRKYVIRPVAAKDIVRARVWYEEKRDGLGDEFLAEVGAAIELAIEHPMAYPVVRRQTRRVLVRRFPYGLLYRLTKDIVVFVACFHTSRSPEAWKKRN